MLTTFVIGLREGLEAALVVSIIAAFLTRRGERSLLRPLWMGVGAAVVVSGLVAVGLSAAGRSLPFREREIMEGSLALIAVGGVTYMIVWMRANSHRLKVEIEERASTAVASGSALAFAAMAFVAVVREGLETAVFLLATLTGSRTPALGVGGALAGIAVAVALGYGLYRGGVRVNLARFFSLSGVVLVFVAAGVVALAVHSFAEAGVVTVLQRPAVDLSALIAPGTVRASLITGFLGLQPVPTVAELAAWGLYLLPMLVFTLVPARSRAVEPATA